jgi:iron complex outermembrane receptor protein
LGPSFYDPVTGRSPAARRITRSSGARPRATACRGTRSTRPARRPGWPDRQSDLQTYPVPAVPLHGRTKEVDYSANVSGSVALPAGDLAIAAGYEHRNESGSFYPDALQIAHLSTSLPGGPTSGKYKVDEYYVEVDVPVKDLPLARELSFNVAGRYSKYDTFGDTTNGKFSLTWKPIDDLLVRANYAQGFRAPTISDLYGGISGTFPYYTDPCDTNFGAAVDNLTVLARCTSGFAGQNATPANFRQPCQGGSSCTSTNSQSGVNLFSGSTPTLQPETATSKTAGLVYSPSWISGLDLSLDWYRIHIKNAITADTLTAQLDDCYIRGIASRCSFFTRFPPPMAPVSTMTSPAGQPGVDRHGRLGSWRQLSSARVRVRSLRGSLEHDLHVAPEYEDCR